MNPRALTVLKVVAPVLLLAVAGAAAMALAGMAADPPIRRPEAPAPLVRVQIVAPADRGLVVTSQGTVGPRTQSRIVPEVSGRVSRLAPDFVAGGFFEAGATLLSLDPYDYEQAVVRARAEVAAARLRLAQEEAEAEVARQEWAELGEGEAPPLTLRVPQLENARAAVAAADAALERAQRDLQRTEIRAPYAGRVREKSVDVGQHVSPGTVLGIVYAIDSVEIRLPLPDAELAFLDLPLSYRGESGRGGPPVTLYADFAGQRFAWTGRIVRSEGVIDPTTRMVHVVAEVRDPYGRGPEPGRPPLAVGMYVRAEIEGIVAENVVVLPRSAVRDDGTVAIADADDRLRFREVTVLRTSRDEAVVQGGLSAGDRVILSALDAPVEGMPLRVTEVSRAAPADGTEGAEGAR